MKGFLKKYLVRAWNVAMAKYIGGQEQGLDDLAMASSALDFIGIESGTMTQVQDAMLADENCPPINMPGARA
jgi:hypothetical protein